MRLSQFLLATVFCAVGAGAAPVARAHAAPGPVIDAGPTDPARVIEVTVALKLPAQALFDRTLAALYDPASPSFHHWLSPAQVAQFAPPADRIAAVRAALERQGLGIVAVESNGFSIRAQGTVAAIARAFNTQLHDFVRNGVSFRAPLAPGGLAGAAGAYVQAVVGLESHVIQPMLARAVDRRTGKPYAPIPMQQVLAGGGLGSVITDQILSAPASFTYSTPGRPLPVGTYSGLVYDANPSLVPDYTSAQLQTAYGLNAAYRQGLSGQGQTIVLLEGFGYPAIQSDANAFSRLNGLPALTASNFSIVYPEGKPPNPLIGYLTGWDGEIALDVQWSHSIAPGANILVVATKGQDSEAFITSMKYIIDHQLGNAVSDSWEENLDLVTSATEQEAFEDVLKVAAAEGISFQFSSGDGGDEGVGSPIGSAGVPSVAPHATAIGGTAILNKIGQSGTVPIGWGDVGGVIANPTGPVVQPALEFVGGGGGGESVFWPKPAWQAALPGTGRQTPDISALSDPFTGVPIVVTAQGKQQLSVGVGGTSLGSPIFTAIWAIANQKAGHALGQAAPIIASLTTGVTDVVPQTSAFDVAGSVLTAEGTIGYSTQTLFGPFIPQAQPFIAALSNQPADNASIVIGFSLDSSLNVTAGWDNATGFGTPDGLAFINAAASYR